MQDDKRYDNNARQLTGQSAESPIERAESSSGNAHILYHEDHGMHDQQQLPPDYDSHARTDCGKVDVRMKGKIWWLD